jgi:hypothetical protein
MFSRLISFFVVLFFVFGLIYMFSRPLPSETFRQVEQEQLKAVDNARK